MSPNLLYVHLQRSQIKARAQASIPRQKTSSYLPLPPFPSWIILRPFEELTAHFTHHIPGSDTWMLAHYNSSPTEDSKWSFQLTNSQPKRSYLAYWMSLTLKCIPPCFPITIPWDQNGEFLHWAMTLPSSEHIYKLPRGPRPTHQREYHPHRHPHIGLGFQVLNEFLSNGSCWRVLLSCFW